MKKLSSRIRGFSLLELMVVMLIIGIVAAFVIPASSTILRGSQMVQASQIITDQFSLARQTAISRNHPVEMRLIQYADPEVPGEVLNGVNLPSNGNFRAIQIVEDIDTTDANGNSVMVRTAVDKPQLLPQGIVMEQNDQFSTLIGEAMQAQQSQTQGVTAGTKQALFQTNPIPGIDPTLPRNIGINYTYVGFRFLPDGSTNLPSKSTGDPNGCWYVTLRNVNDVNPQLGPGSLTTGAAGGTRPVNFFTLLVDPVSGTTRQFRPGI
jgi:uncharacterized protein (TIGR02596 family)